MNHRQWKKKYKAKHGRNPFSKKQTQFLSQYGIGEERLMQLIEDFANTIINGWDCFMENMKNFAETLSDFEEAAKKYNEDESTQDE